MTARTALKDLQRLTDPLYAQQSILPPKPTFTGQQRCLITGWKAYLQWEQENKLVIEDKEALAARIGYAFKQCIGQMRHFPELWYVLAYWTWV
jgi:cleavage stimulation factor subunit 3